MRIFILLFSLLLSNTGCAMGRGRVATDPVTQSTVLDGDATSLIEGCGNQPIVGFTYCRMEEGSTSDQTLWFIGPPAKCDQKEACVYIKVWNNQGVLVWGGSIPKGNTRVGVSWTTLLSAPQFQVNNRGFFTFNTQVFWKDLDGKERVSTSQGDIILRVYRHGYLPLNEVVSDSNFVWTWTEGSYLYRMTSSLRAFVKKVK
jgi:hypothetical protein